ncbi:hypothetical protein SLS56_011390 [Neofusicoccum ribis]|uniref:Transcription factor domain-containing protein n=1 Tax=Neofusicoccum ribis TaxID=45134 RepID=A0ABR3SBS9_9PEZI
MGGAESPIAREIVPALGLRNTLGQYPFINAETEDEKTRELEKLLPTNQETLSFYQVYRTISFHLSPLIVDIEQFESHLADYLERSAGSDRIPPTITFEKERAARTALLLATLAAGAQYSDRTAEERRKISRTFGTSTLMAIVQQDCILSLCYDRPTALAYMPFGLASGRNHKLNHQEVMWEISRLGLNLLANRDSEANVESMQRQLRGLQQVMLSSVEHLQNREKCKGLQERIEFFSISLHKAFLTAAVCRPTFRKRPQPNHDTEYLNLLSTGKKALESAVKAFLNMGSLTIYPTRSWICIHEALSSALLLTILGETRSSESLKNMQKKLIDVLLSNAQDESPRLNHALTSSHLKALMTLRSLTQETPQRSVVYSRPLSQQTIDPPVPRALDSGDTAVSQSEGLGAAINDSIFENLQSDLSPMAFLDSIIWDKSFPEEDTAFLGFEFGE